MKIGIQSIDPVKFGIPLGKPEEMRADSPAASASIIRLILLGRPGSARDIVVLNAAAAIQTSGLAKTWFDGIKLAEQSIDSGQAGVALERLAKVSHEK